MLRLHRPAVSGLRALLALLLLCAWFADPAEAQRRPEGDQGGGMEKFEEVDPYTEGEAEVIEAAGYARIGHGPWTDGVSTQDLQQTMGGIDMLFVETEHFRIASSLGTYEIPNHRRERDKIEDEIKRLKKKMGRFRAPRNELDPWLRLHLYAQRAEDQYDSFCEEFGLEESDFSEQGPHLGFPNKFLLLLCERKSDFGRYVRAYHNAEYEYSFRTVKRGDTLVVAANIEALQQGYEREEEMPFDTMLHNQMTSVLIATFIDGFQGNMFSAPRWLAYGLAHAHLRRIDPEWPAFDGRKPGQGDRDHWEWEGRVQNLVSNDFFASAEEMFGWREYGDLNTRDHMVVWSKTVFLLDELKGDKKGFLQDVCSATGGFSTKEEDTQLVERQRAAFEKHFGLTPEEFDEKWARWAKREYR